MRVIFTCGGTAGHVNPALALAGLIRARKPDSEILFVGARRGIEPEDGAVYRQFPPAVGFAEGAFFVEGGFPVVVACE